LLSHVSGVSYFWNKPREHYKDFVIAVKKGFIQDQKSSFTNLGKKLLNIRAYIPQHVAIIPDGNRRWAKEKGFVSTKGHEVSASYENILGIIKEAQRLGIKYLTFWAFSTENWKRDKKEISFLFSTARALLVKLRKEAEQNKVKFTHLGRRDRLPKELVGEIEKLEDATSMCNDISVLADSVSDCLDSNLADASSFVS
jgi:undecaprenyl pyrophosphate synthase